MQSYLAFLQSLIQIDSTNPPGNEQAIIQQFINRSEATGLPYQVMTVDNNRSNFSVRINGSNTDKGKLLLNGHTDTVKIGSQKWQYNPFDAHIEDGKLYGRGTTDMKSGLAALYLALESLYLENYPLKKNVEFLATAGEEVDSIGATHYVNTQGMSDVEAIVIAEPTHERVVVGHKGALWIEVKVTGKTAHGAMPEQGVNAIEAASEIIHLVERLKTEWKVRHDPLGTSSISVNMIQGGIQTNVIPDECILYVDIRSVIPNCHDKLYHDFNQALQSLFEGATLPNVEAKIILNREAVLTNEQSQIIQDALTITQQQQVGGVSYYTDASVLNSSSDIPTLIYGPGIETLAHQPDEYVEVAAFERSIAFYKSLIIQYAG